MGEFFIKLFLRFVVEILFEGIIAIVQFNPERDAEERERVFRSKKSARRRLFLMSVLSFVFAIVLLLTPDLVSFLGRPIYEPVAILGMFSLFSLITLFLVRYAHLKTDGENFSFYRPFELVEEFTADDIDYIENYARNKYAIVLRCGKRLSFFWMRYPQDLRKYLASLPFSWRERINEHVQLVEPRKANEYERVDEHEYSAKHEEVADPLISECEREETPDEDVRYITDSEEELSDCADDEHIDWEAALDKESNAIGCASLLALPVGVPLAVLLFYPIVTTYFGIAVSAVSPELFFRIAWGCAIGTFIFPLMVSFLTRKFPKIDDEKAAGDTVVVAYDRGAAMGYLMLTLLPSILIVAWNIYLIANQETMLNEHLLISSLVLLGLVLFMLSGLHGYLEVKGTALTIEGDKITHRSFFRRPLTFFPTDIKSLRSYGNTGYRVRLKSSRRKIYVLKLMDNFEELNKLLQRNRAFRNRN